MAVILGLLAFAAIAVFPFLAFGYQMWSKNRRYSLQVPGYGLVSTPGPFTGEEIAKALQTLEEEAPNQDLSRLDDLKLEWIKAKGSENWIIDKWGRKVAGYYAGGVATVTWAPGVPVGKTALLHELCHGILDGRHQDPDHDHKHPLFEAMAAANRRLI